MALYGSDPAQYYAQQQQLQQQKMAQMINMFMQMQQMKQQKQQQGIANQQGERRLDLQEQQQRATAPWYAARTESLMNPDPTTYQRRTSGMTPEQISEFNKFGNLQRPGKTPEQIRIEAEARAKGAGTGKFKPPTTTTTTGRGQSNSEQYFNKIYTELGNAIKFKRSKLGETKFSLADGGLRGIFDQTSEDTPEIIALQKVQQFLAPMREKAYSEVLSNDEKRILTVFSKYKNDIDALELTMEALSNGKTIREIEPYLKK